jgi:type IV secretion system protein VirB5
MKTELRNKRETEMLYQLQSRVINGLTKGAYERERKTAKINKILLLCIPISFGITLFALTRPQTKVDIVEIAPWGEAKYIADVKQTQYSESSVPEVAREWQIREFIKNLRSLSTDQEVVYDNYNKCYNCATKTIGKKLTAEIQSAGWLKEVGQYKRTVNIESVIKVSDYSYQVDWIEKKTLPSGEDLKTYKMRAVITIKLMTPTSDKRILNPSGIYITDYDMTVIQEMKNEEN